MLQFFSIENFALIDRLEVNFEGGLNLITGETGSGKSILVDAFGLLLGSRASQQMIRQGAEGARVEGLFELPADHPALALLAEGDIEVDSGQLIVRRDLSVSGSNKVFINGRLAPLSLLSAVGAALADIHGQHDQQQLLDPAAHLDFLDAFGGCRPQREALEKTAAELAALQRRRSELASKLQERLQRQDLLRFQIDEIERLELSPGLDEALREESRLLASAQQRQQLAARLYAALYEDESSLISGLGAIESELAGLAELDDRLAECLQPASETRFQLEELAFRLRDYADKIEWDPNRLEEIEERLAALQKAFRKYAPTVDELIETRERARAELDELDTAEERSQALDGQIEGLEAGWRQSAAVLTATRREAAARLEEAVVAELAELAMPQTRFRVALTETGEPYLPTGSERAQFLLSANPGEDPRPLARIASGGEISRVMLALKSLQRIDEHSRTMVFDEIDAGIGGRVADGLGRRLAELAERHQVFCVTHLPQIAAWADRHLNVSKREESGRTVVRLEALNEERRVEELSRMLAGEEVTEAARRHALELLRTAR